MEITIQTLLSLIGELRQVLQSLGMGGRVTTTFQLEEQVKSYTFKVLVIGEISKGKTTLINALLGDEIWPSYGPCTLINVVKWGDNPQAFLHFKESVDGSIAHPQPIPVESLKEYAPEPLQSPYSKVELFWPLNLCRHDVEIYELPGRYLDERNVVLENLKKSDAVLFVMSCTSLGSSFEKEWIDTIRQLGHENIFLICNRFDMIRKEDRERFREYALSRLAPLSKRGEEGVFFISAFEALEGRLENNPQRVEQSGVRQLEAAFTTFLTEQRGAVKIRRAVTTLKKVICEARKTIAERRSFLVVATDEARMARIKQKAQWNALDHRLERLESINKRVDGLMSQVMLAGLKDRVDISSQLAFASDLLNKYRWEQNQRGEILAFIQKIQERVQDPSLYLAVVGEFSSGKSTFINALIRDDLLATDVLQATTSAATVLRYGQELKIEAICKEQSFVSKRKNNSWLNQWRHGHACPPHFLFETQEIKPPAQSSKQQLQEFLKEVTANEEIAQNIEKVMVFHPSPVLEKGLTIIDIPGSNVGNARHVQIAGWAIREMSDAAIVTIPANIPLSQSLVNFLRTHLSDVIHRCIFVITKIDLIRRKERSRLLQNITTRLQSEFQLSQPVVLPSSPQLLLEHFVDGDAVKGLAGQKLIEKSLHSEAEIQRILQLQRVSIILERISLLITDLFAQLSNHLKQMEEGYRQRHQALEQNRITNLGDFVIKQKAKHAQQIKQQASPLYGKIALLIEHKKPIVQQHISAALDRAQSAQELKNVVEYAYWQEMQNVLEEVNHAFSSQVQNLTDIGRKELAVFESEFKQLYQSLATLGGQVTVDELVLEQNELVLGGNSQAIQVAREMQDMESWSQGGGAAGGAAIGTLILPGIGTAIGAGIGWFLGKWYAEEQFNNYRQKCRWVLQNSIEQSFLEMQHSINNRLEEAIEHLIQDLERIIQRYFQQYDELVRDMMARDQAEAAQLEEIRANIQGDLSSLITHQQQLVHSRKKLR